MITKRIIPCLDVRNGRVVKGMNFEGLKDVDDPVKLAEYYSSAGADELVFYDITASHEGRKLFTDILVDVASKIFIPLTVGGGINGLEDFAQVLACGADKVSVNSGAIRNPRPIPDAANKYGSHHVFQNGGRIDTGLDALEWIKDGVKHGAGEVVLNSIDTDGVKQGFDLEMLKAVNEIVRVPVIASGGAGSMQDFADLFHAIPDISAGLAASIFHYGDVTIHDLKEYLKQEGIAVRL